MLNKVILMGRLTRDPELRHTQNDKPVVSFTIAVDRGYKKGNDAVNADFINLPIARETAQRGQGIWASLILPKLSLYRANLKRLSVMTVSFRFREERNDE